MPVTLPGGVVPQQLGDRANIEHVVVLMFENQSYDRILGALHGVDPRYDGLAQGAVVRQLLYPGDPESIDVPIWHHGTPGAGWARREPWRTEPDPGHTYSHVVTQCTGARDHRAFEHGSLPMNGFWGDWIAKRRRSGGHGSESPADRRAASDFLSPIALDQLPAFHTLARRYAVCTRWFSSVPAHTLLNRMFVHAGTSGGVIGEASVKPLVSTLLTIFHRLSDDHAPGRDWRVYTDDFSQVFLFPGLWPGLVQGGRRRSRQRLFEDISAGDLPKYTFVEPNHLGRDKDYMHPPSDIRRGDAFLARLYAALRSNEPLWRKTLFVVTFDEHGGFYDHVPPAATVAPDDRHNPRFDFKRFGPRVPAILASPWIAPGTVIDDPLDHTAVLRLVHRRFGTEPLGRRDRLGADPLSTWTFLTDAAGQNLPQRIPAPLPGLPDESASEDTAMDGNDNENLTQILRAAGAIGDAEVIPEATTYAEGEKLLREVMEARLHGLAPGLAVADRRVVRWLNPDEPAAAEATEAFLRFARGPSDTSGKGVPGVVRPQVPFQVQPTGAWRAVARRFPITPALGTPLSGMGPIVDYRATGWWGHMYATVILFEDPDGERLALLAADLHGASRYVLERVGARTAALGLPVERLFGTCVHTHQGPGTFYGNDWYDRVSGFPNGFDHTFVEPLVQELVRVVAELAAGLPEAPEVRLGYGQELCWGLTHNRSDIALVANFSKVPPSALWRQAPWQHLARARIGAASVEINGLNGVADIPAALLPPPTDDPSDYGSSRAAVDARLRALCVETAEGQVVAGLCFIGATTTFLSNNARIASGDVLGVAGMRMAEELRGAAAARVPFAYVGSGHGDACFIDPERSREPFRRTRWKADSWEETAIETDAAREVVERLVRATRVAWDQARANAAGGDLLGARRLEVAFAEPDIAAATLGPAGPLPPAGEADPCPAGQALGAGAEMGTPATAGSELEHFFPSDTHDEGETAGALVVGDPHSPMRLLRREFTGEVIKFLRAGDVVHAAPFATLRRVKLGALTLVGVPGEPTTWLAHRIERRLAGEGPVLIAGISGDYLGYFTTGREYVTQQYEGASSLWGRASGEWVLQQLAAMQGVKRRFAIAPFATRVDRTPLGLGPIVGQHPTGPPHRRITEVKRVVIDGVGHLRISGWWKTKAPPPEGVTSTRAWVRLLLRDETGTGDLVVNGTSVDDSRWPTLIQVVADPSEDCRRVFFRTAVPYAAHWQGKEIGFDTTAAAMRPVDPNLASFVPIP